MEFDSTINTGLFPRRNRSKLLEYTGEGDLPTHTRSDPNVWARDLIKLRTNKQNQIPFFYKESLRFMISKLGSLSYLNSETQVVDVKCVHAHPERTIAKLHQENNIILPIISINQDTSDNDDDRRRNSTSLVIDRHWSEDKKRAYRLISLAPRAVNINYGINIWAKYKNNLDQLSEQIRLIFNPHLTIRNPYTNEAMAYIESERDDSSTSVADGAERILRKSFDITLEAYIPTPKFLITSTGEIQEFKGEATIY